MEIDGIIWRKVGIWRDDEGHNWREFFLLGGGHSLTRTMRRKGWSGGSLERSFDEGCSR